MLVTDPVGPIVLPNPHRIEDLPPLIIGGATFNYQYTDNPEATPVYEILDLAFSSGLIALDTSPYYGPSEILIGKALKELASKWPRESYFICTKAGRIGLNEFDFSRVNVRKSVERSLQRLHTTYLDLVYLHDIEFGHEEQIIEGLKELKKLKDEGIVKNIGITGYPVQFLYKMALVANEDEEIGPLDAILSYSNGCIQNVTLFDYYEKFINECNIKKIMNGSILSMSLLRSQPTHSFHPASDDLKSSVKNVAKQLLNSYNLELADLATRFALKKWLFDTYKGDQVDENNLTWNNKTSVVLGLSNVDELKVAITNYWNVKLNINQINNNDESKFNEVKSLLGIILMKLGQAELNIKELNMKELYRE